MSVTRMTIHRGLSELKLLDSRISKAITNFQPVAVKQMDKIMNGNTTIADFEKQSKAEFDSINSLIARKTKIKKAIVISNANTQVEIAGKKLSVSDAITMKSDIELQKDLLRSIAQKKNACLAQVNRGNEAVKANLQTILVASFGKDTSKHDKKMVEETTKSFMDLNEFNLVDPINVDEIIVKLDKEIHDFEAEVDAVLSESNSTTFIEVED